MLKKITVTVCVISMLFSFFACEKNPEAIETKSRTFYDYFDTVSSIQDYSGMDRAEFNTLADAVEEKLAEYHKLYDIYNEYEGIVNLATINRLAGHGAVKVDGKIIDLLEYSVYIYEITDGYTNIAMGSVLKIWHDKRSEGKEIPTLEELSEAEKHTDIKNLVIDRDALTVEIKDPEMSLDVGAVAKGYAVEEIAKMIEGEGYSGVVLDVGRNLRAVGSKPNGDGWKSAVLNPDLLAEDRYVYRLTINDEALVTSGDYERFYTVGGKKYHHIIDKDTLFPSEHYSSVTVKAESSALADALSTALFSMDMEQVKEVVKRLDGVFVILVDRSGAVITV